MSSTNPQTSSHEDEPLLLPRRDRSEVAAQTAFPAASPQGAPRPRRRHPIAALVLLGLLMLLAAAALGARLWARHAMRAALPQIDGFLSLPGLSAPVAVLRDAHGVPTLRATSLDDLLFAQGFVTAGDRLFQMDGIRRHAAGELAEILGSAYLEHDRLQRTLGIRDAADRAFQTLPPGQLHELEAYARGVNASIALQREHLPIEFRLLHYTPAPWTPRDSLLVGLALFEDLTDSFPTKLNRDALAAHLDPSLPAATRQQLLADLYPVGSWRDHPPSQSAIDLSAPVDQIEQIPLDPSQVQLRPTATPTDLLALTDAVKPQLCTGCRAGSNEWVVAGARTATGQPLLSNDMHLSHSVPGIWYDAGLECPASATTPALHVAGVTLPGTPFVIVGHNAHVAWGFTNLGADVQDLTVEHLRGAGAQEQFLAADGSWRPLLHRTETIHIRGHADLTFDVLLTQHGNLATPILSPLLPSESRPISLRWTIFDPANISSPFLAVNTAASGPALAGAFAHFGGPAQNLVYADDHGTIGYHALGRIPIRGSLAQPTALSPVPTDAAAPEASTHEWAGYIPYDQLPQSINPAGGVLGTANSRITPDTYPFPITLDWGDPYRNERIWRQLTGRSGLTPADMLALQTDVYSDVDHVIAQRLAYAIDHSTNPSKRLHQAADLLRSWDGVVSLDSPAATITDAARAALWPLLLKPKLTPDAHARTETWKLYTWGERTYAEELLIQHTPERWLPPQYTSWNDLLTAAVDQGLAAEHAPSNLAKWRYGAQHPVDIEHPLLSATPILGHLLDLPVGTGAHPQSGDGTTVKQVGHTFGPSERFTADLADPDRSTLNLVLGESGNPASAWYLDQFPAWLAGSTFAAPFSDAAVQSTTAHTLTLTPR